MAAQLISEAEELAEISKLVPEASCTRIASTTAGLDAEEAARRLAAAGSSIVTHQHKPTVLTELWEGTRNPLNALLLTLAATSALMGDMRAAIVIAKIIVLAILTGFVHEHRSNNARRASAGHGEDDRQRAPSYGRGNWRFPGSPDRDTGSRRHAAIGSHGPVH